jgi:predicted N-acyltransferase
MDAEAEPQFLIRVENGLSGVSAEAWDACAPQGKEYSPFTSHAFLLALETSDSVSAETGWLPQHLLLEDSAGNMLGAMACYLKSHSQGEYVFDHGWADAYERAGGHYYPKLQVSIPFTPATCRKLLVPRGALQKDRETALVSGAVELCSRLSASSIHLTFLTEPEYTHLGEMGLLQRKDQQFHWINEGYASFDDFLAALSSRKRKNLKKERVAAVANEIEIEWVTGKDLTEDHWDAFFHFYMDTGARKWGQPYLTRAFFSLVSETMADNVLLVMARRDGRYIAGALNFIGGDTLYGRNWGCIEDHRFLHFELCYYQAIEFAISRGLKKVEAGAQGQHKLARGYLPVPTYSAHYLADPGLARAVEEYLDRERRHVEQEISILQNHGPFKSAGNDQ